MRGVGTSPGGAGGFGAEGDALGGFGDRSGGHPENRAGAGLRRDGRDGGGGGHRDRLGGRDPESRARAFQGRMDDARRRLGRGSGEDEHRQIGEPAGDAAQAPAPPFSVALRVAERGAGRHPGTGQDPAGAGDPAVTGTDPRCTDLPGGDRRAAPAVVTGAAALGDGAPRRLIAAAEPPTDALAALFALSVPGTPAAPAEILPGADALSLPAAVERRIADIADRVERALQDDLAAGAGTPIALRIPLDEGGDGFNALIVTATAQGLDVTLVRAVDGASPSPELLGAAQALAERLQLRLGRSLGRGSVRLFEGVEGADGPAAAARPAEDGWAGLTALLRRRTG